MAKSTKKKKLKTHKGAAKRIKVTGSGKFVHYKAGKRHLLVKKGKNKTRRDKYGRVVSSADEKNIKALLPYAM